MTSTGGISDYLGEVIAKTREPRLPLGFTRRIMRNLKHVHETKRNPSIHGRSSIISLIVGCLAGMLIIQMAMGCYVYWRNVPFQGEALQGILHFLKGKRVMEFLSISCMLCSLLWIDQWIRQRGFGHK